MNSINQPNINEITITRALAELSLLDDKISKKIHNSEFVFLWSKKQKMRKDDPSVIKANFQSINDLIQRRNKLKSAIVLSNASTKVTLGGESLTVAEVIERKQLLPYYESLLEKMKGDRKNVLNRVEILNTSMESDLQKILEINFGKANNIKTNPEEIENISKVYRDNNSAEMIDPLDIDKRITELEEILNTLKTESNFVLSESNAVTKILV